MRENKKEVLRFQHASSVKPEMQNASNICRTLRPYIINLLSLLPSKYKRYSGKWYGVHVTEVPWSDPKRRVLSFHHYDLKIGAGGYISGSLRDEIGRDTSTSTLYECHISGSIDGRRMILDVERITPVLEGHHKIELYYLCDPTEIKGYIIGRNFNLDLFVTKIVLTRNNPLPDKLREFLADDLTNLSPYNSMPDE